MLRVIDNDHSDRNRILDKTWTSPFEVGYPLVVAGPYKSRSISRITGFKPALLRAWERRFGLLDPERTQGGHRLYSDDDLVLLLHIREALAAGRTIGELAQEGRSTLLASARADRPPGISPKTPISIPTTPPVLRPTGVRRRLVSAAVGIDPHAIRAALEDAFVQLDPDVVVHEILGPAARRIGELWEEGACSVAGEHLASAAIQDRLLQLIRRANLAAPLRAPEILFACFPDERHDLPGLIQAYAVARAGLQVTWLGATLPFPDLELAARVRRPAGLGLSVSIEAHWRAGRDELEDLLRALGDEVLVAVGGAGAPARDEDLEALGLVLQPTDLVGLVRARQR